MPDAPTWDLVLRRNQIERLKRDKFPLDVINDLPQLIERGYEEMSEEDVVRFMWYGLYHDRPKVGYFMMRVKIPSGILTPNKLRTIGQLSQRYGRDEGELSTRQNVQLHWIKLDHLPEILPTLEAAGLTTLGGCGDCVRNITGCPVAGIDREELFDCTALIEEAAGFFYGNRTYSDLPRKHKISIASCSHQCNAPALNCINLIGTFQDGEIGYAIRVGGGLSTVPRLSRHLDVFVPQAEAMDVMRAILDAWRTNLTYRLSRVKARMKFMVDDFGPEAFRVEVEKNLGRRMRDLKERPLPNGDTEHLGINPQKQEGKYYIGFPAYLGKVTGGQLIQIADIADSVGGDIRLTRQQNFIVAGVPELEVERVVREIGEIGFPLDVNALRGTSQGCTGSPLCNYSVAETKTRLDEIVQHLEGTFGRRAEGIIVNVDGCPHACAHHWTADIGLQGSTLRERGASGEKLEAYEIYLRGSLGEDAAIGRPIVRRVPAEQAKFHVERLITAFLDEREPGERFKQFADRKADEELIAIATDRPLEDVVNEAAALKSRRGAATAVAEAEE